MRKIQVIEDFTHFLLESIVRLVPKGPQFVEMLLTEVRKYSIIDLPAMASITAKYYTIWCNQSRIGI